MSWNGTADGVVGSRSSRAVAPIALLLFLLLHVPPRLRLKARAKTLVKATPAPAKNRAPKMTTPTAATANVQVFDSSWSATAFITVSGEPLGNAFLHGNTAHVVPVSQQPTVSLLPLARHLRPGRRPNARKRKSIDM